MRIGKERCEHKAYPHGVYSDRNRIRLHVNGALGKPMLCKNKKKSYTF